MKKDISENDNVVICGSLVGWGDEMIPLFTLAVRLVTDTEATHMEFIEWTRKYDTGSVNMRSRAQHDEWQKLKRLMKPQTVKVSSDCFSVYNGSV